jgi:hypothetical protein
VQQWTAKVMKCGWKDCQLSWSGMGHLTILQIRWGFLSTFFPTEPWLSKKSLAMLLYLCVITVIGMLIIGKSPKPHCVKNTKILPTKSHINKKAWVTAIDFFPSLITRHNYGCTK